MRWTLPIIFCCLTAAAPLSFEDHNIGDVILSHITSPIIMLVHIVIRRIHHLSQKQAKALPIRALNLPSYGNWTDGEGWKLHVHGNVFRQPNASNHTLDKWARLIMIFGTKVKDLPQEEQDLARNMTAEILTLAVGEDSVRSMDIKEQGEREVERRTVDLPPTINTGDFDGWLPLGDMSQLRPGNDSATPVQQLDLLIHGANGSESTGFLVPPNGISIVSDVDDILRTAQIWNWRHMLESAISREFEPWKNMPEVFGDMAHSISAPHFHYLTVPPEFLSRKYRQFLRGYYPDGTLDTLPMDFANGKSLFHGRRFLLDRLFETFKTRKFILVGDNSNRDLMKHYPAMLRAHPEQVQCILMRNTSLTEKSYWFKNLPTHFKGLNESKFMFFKKPDDLKGINFAEGGCVNNTVHSNLDESGNFVTAGFRVLVWKLLCHITHAELFDCPVKGSR